MTSRASLRSVRRAPIALLLLAGAASLLPFLQGCKDADTEARANVQQQLDSIASSYSTAVTIRTPLTTDQSLVKVEELLNRTGSLSGGSPEQQAAASVMSASMAQTIAEMHMEKARELAREIARDRSLASANADAAAALKSLADATSNVSLSKDRDLLKEQQQLAEATLKKVQEAYKELAKPIATLRTGVEAARSELATLQAQADDLRRQAIEAGASAGFPLIEEAAEVKGEARGVRTSVALNEIELSELEPELAFTNASLVAAEALKSAAESALGDLENYAATLSSDATATSKVADDFRKSTEALLAQIADRSKALTEVFERVESSLTRAESAAGRGASASRELANTARQAKLAAQTTLGALLAERASVSAAQMQLHETLASSGQLFGGSAKQKEAIDALSAEREEFTTRAKDKLIEALAAIGEPGENDNPATRATRNAINRMVTSLEGKPAVANPDAPGAPASTPLSGGATPADSVAGFESPEALVSALTANDVSMTLKTLNATRATSAEARQLVRFLQGATEVSANLVEAATQKWGTEALTAIAAAVPGGGLVTSAKVVDQTADSATVEAVGANGTTQNLSLVKENNGWRVDGDAMLAAMTDQERAGLKMMAGVMSTTRPAIKRALDAVAAKIRSGEIASADQIGPAIEAAMMAEMGAPQ